MVLETKQQRNSFEFMLIIVVIGMAALFFMMRDQGLIGLNLFFLPVMLSGYYLGRTHAGILALFSALLVTIAATAGGGHFSGYASPLMIGLVLTIWAAVLGLMSILIGTLCDERLQTMRELQKAYVGVVEVLSKYLQSANPRVKARSTRVSELAQALAQELKLPRRQIDDVQVAALLHDLESVQVTTQIASRAVSALEASPGAARHTFLGTDLVQSLGRVLEGALPLLVSQDELMHAAPASDGYAPTDAPLGAKVIAVARLYDDLVCGGASGLPVSSDDAIRELRKDLGEPYADVLDALRRVVSRSQSTPPVHALAGVS